MKCAETGPVTLNSYLRAGKMMFDRHPQATIYSHRPIGLGQDELKWEFPGFGVVTLNLLS